MKKRKKKISVLVVDDERIIQNYIYAALSDPRFVVKTVGDGAAAVVEVEQNEFDLLFVDMRLPGIDGIEVCRQVKRIRPGLRVILITAYRNHRIVRQAREAGVEEVLFKPIELEELVRVAMKSSP